MNPNGVIKTYALGTHFQLKCDSCIAMRKFCSRKIGSKKLFEICIWDPIEGLTLFIVVAIFFCILFLMWYESVFLPYIMWHLRDQIKWKQTINNSYTKSDIKKNYKYKSFSDVSCKVLKCLNIKSIFGLWLHLICFLIIAKIAKKCSLIDIICAMVAQMNVKYAVVAI